MAKKYYACVYGGASDKISANILKEVEKLGKIIVDNGFSLVYGAGASGAMGAVATGVSQNGGYVMGISPHFIKKFEPIFPCDNTVIVETMEERKMLMEKHGDIFIIAPGGIGTMDEFFQVLTLKYLKRLNAPIVILNIDGFYDSLVAFVKDLAAFGAFTPKITGYFDVVTSVSDPLLIKYFNKIKQC